jgi:hypothetical protein
MKNKLYYLIMVTLLLAMPLINADVIFAAPENITTPIQAISYINNLTDVGSGAMFGTIIYFLVSMALFMGMKGYSNERALAVALFISSIIGFLLRVFGWINDTGVYLALIFMIFGLWQLWRKND